MSRSEDILKSIVNDTDYNNDPKSRIESLLLELKDILSSERGSVSGSIGVITIKDCNAFLKTGYAKSEKDDIVNVPTEVSGTDGEWGIVHCIIENDQYGTGTQMYYPVDGDYAGRVFTRSISDMKTDNPNPGEWSLLAITSEITEEYTLPVATAEKIGGVKVGNGLEITEEGVLSVPESGSGGAFVGKPTFAEPISSQSIPAITDDGFLFIAYTSNGNPYIMIDSYASMRLDVPSGQGDYICFPVRAGGNYSISGVTIIRCLYIKYA